MHGVWNRLQFVFTHAFDGTHEVTSEGWMQEWGEGGGGGGGGN